MRATALAMALCLTLAGQQAYAQSESFELPFCAQFGSYPMADRERGGFDIEIANLLADELNANATFIWTRFDDVGIRDTLHSGVCDAVIGVGEGVAQMMSTVPYLNAGYAFVTRAEDSLSIDSLDDPQLRELSIGTYQAALPTVALRNRGILENVTEYAAIIRPTGVDPHTPILDGLVAGEVDVAIVYGPYAAARAAEEDTELSLSVLTPEVDFGSSLLQLSRILTIGVRTHDEALRDDLNRALANRWEDVQAILDNYGVPRFDVPRPRVTDELAGATRVGVIFPASTPAALPNAPVGDDARRTVRVAENAVSERSDSEVPFLVLNAHAPTVEAVERAARRLVLVDDVHALIGGYTPASANTLATVAAELDVPFFNVGSAADSLRTSVCYPTTFHVAPSTSMKVAATISALVEEGQRVFVVAAGGSEAQVLVEQVEERLSAAGAEPAGSAVVEPAQFVYYPLLQEIGTANVDSVLLIMSSDSQEVFMGQAASLLPGVSLLGVSPVGGNSRPYLERFRQATQGADPAPRIVTWDPSLDAAINEVYSSRTAEPMVPAAWTTYAAIVVAFEAAGSGALGTAEELRTYLLDSDVSFSVGKTSDVSFRDDGQMIQELYVVEANADASWGRTAAARTAIASVVEVVPPEVTASATSSVEGACGAF